MSKIVVGTVAQLAIGVFVGAALLQTDASWVKFLFGTGAILRTFLPGAELDPQVLRVQWKEASAVGLVSFAMPFFGCAAPAHYARASARVCPPRGSRRHRHVHHLGVVVYAVMLEFGCHVTDYGKTVLAACFITDLATVLAFGFMFSPLTWKTLVFFGASFATFAVLPWSTSRFLRRFGERPSELEAKFLLACLFGLEALAAWADSEAVLPAYVIGMVLAGSVGKDHALIRRLRPLTFGLPTPFYCIHTGALVSVLKLLAAPGAFLVLLLGKMMARLAGVYPVMKLYQSPNKEAMYTTLIMSTGLAFGTLSALFGLSHGIVDRAQYALLVAAMVGSAMVPILTPSSCRIVCCRRLQPSRPCLRSTHNPPNRSLPEAGTRRHMSKNILIVCDGSESADKAYRFALDCARHVGARLLMLSVARPPEPPENVETKAMPESAEQHYRERFKTLRREAEAKGLKPQFRVVVGHPAEQILYQAEKEGWTTSSSAIAARASSSAGAWARCRGR